MQDGNIEEKNPRGRDRGNHACGGNLGERDCCAQHICNFRIACFCFAQVRRAKSQGGKKQQACPARAGL